MIWVTANILDIRDKLEVYGKANRLMMEWILKQDKPSEKLKEAPMESDTIHIKPFGNSDGWKGLKGLNI